MVRRLLIANRGEIAVRIVRACRELGIESVVVYSSVDASAPHVRAADRAVEIGPPAPADSYLSIPRILDAAHRENADAIHPGYGFLSENAAFAAACRTAGLAFVGPPPEVLARMGSKIEARRAALAAGVPVVPGETPDDQSDAGVCRAVERIGLPALIKPSAGGGGKGMRVVRRDDEVHGAIQAARREADAAFGDGTLYVERLLDRPRHIEFQVLGDDSGNLIHLFERECSIQRRHQKIIEESPSPALSPATRTRMGAAAIAVARAAAYRNAGTVEFLVEGTGDEARFYFLEVNARLQVEHPVTEAITGIDLVQAQLHLAAGRSLPWRQEEITQRGHALECRVYAEDPARDFLPQAGRVTLYREPSAPGVRIDSGIAAGCHVPIHYDPLLAKLVAWHESRDRTIARAKAALQAFPILGIQTNAGYLSRILEHPRFKRGDIDTTFADMEHEWLVADQPDDTVLAAVSAAVVHERDTRGRSDSPARPSVNTDPWAALKGWTILGRTG